MSLAQHRLALSFPGRLLAVAQVLSSTEHSGLDCIQPLECLWMPELVAVYGLSLAQT